MKNKKLKIAIVSDAIYPYNKGGKEKRIYELSTRLANSGHDVHLYSMKWWKGNSNHRIENGVSLHSISKHYPLYSGKRRSISQAVFFALSCLKLIKEDFDVIEVDHMPHLVLFSTKIVSLLKGKKLYATWNEVWGRKYWNEYLGKLGNIAYIVEWLSARMPDEIIAVSEHTKNRLINDLKIKKEIHVVPNGIDLDVIKKVKPSEEKSDIIFAGRLLSHKNVDLLIKSIKLLKKDYPKIKALIVGDGPEKKKLANLIEKLKLQKNVKLLGFLEENNTVYSLFKSSKVFVFPSIREGFGIAALEANACNLPVVTVSHKDNATRHLISSGKNGFVVEPNSNAIANGTSFILKQKIDVNIVRRTRKYDWESIKNNMEGVYYA